MSNLDAILAEYNKNSEATSGSKGSQVDLTNYFSTFIPKGVNEAVKRIRLLPPDEGQTPFTKVFYHTVKVDGRYPKFMCPKEMDGEDCPFCEANTLLLDKKTDEDRKLSYKYKPKQGYILKVIDRDKEDEGVKFWRINHSFKKEGNYDKIISLFKLSRKDLTDPVDGIDLILSINRNSSDIPIVSSIVTSYDGVTPLSDDKSKEDVWTNDSRTWRDVYTVKGYDYLRILVEGGEPTWDRDAKKYVDKNADKNTDDNDYDDLNSELTIGGGETGETPKTETKEVPKTETGETPKTETKEVPKTETKEAKPSNEEEEDDYPF